MRVQRSTYVEARELQTPEHCGFCESPDEIRGFNDAKLKHENAFAQRLECRTI